MSNIRFLIDNLSGVENLDDVKQVLNKLKEVLRYLEKKQAQTNTTITSVPGTLDHGLLAGLADDDHPQYLLLDP